MRPNDVGEVRDVVDRIENGENQKMDEEIKHGIRFDPTINLGHVITFIGFIVAIFVSWTTLDKRVLVLEESRNTQAHIDKTQDMVLGQQMQQIRESLTDLKNGVQRVNDRLDKVGR